MKRDFVSVALALALVLPLAGSVAFSQGATDPAGQNQPPTHHMPNPHQMAMRLSRQLNLTPDQTAKIEPILAERQQKVQAVKSNTALTPAQMHQQLHSIGKTTHVQLAGVLTPDQMQQLKSIHKAHGAKQNTAPPNGM